MTMTMTSDDSLVVRLFGVRSVDGWREFQQTDLQARLSPDEKEHLPGLTLVITGWTYKVSTGPWSDGER